MVILRNVDDESNSEPLKKKTRRSKCNKYNDKCYFLLYILLYYLTAGTTGISSQIRSAA